MYTLLLVDNNKSFLEAWTDLLKIHGYHILSSFTLEDASLKIRNNNIHLALIDVRMKNDRDINDISGIEFASRIEFEYLPKLIITDFPNWKGTRLALSTVLKDPPPALDYLSKKDESGKLINVKDIIATIDDLLKKTYSKRMGIYGKLIYLNDRDIFLLNESQIELTNNELKILKKLYENSNRVCSFEYLIKIISPEQSLPMFTEKKNIKNIVYRIRRKIEPNNKMNNFIKTIREKGYLLNPNPFSR